MKVAAWRSGSLHFIPYTSYFTCLAEWLFTLYTDCLAEWLFILYIACLAEWLFRGGDGSPSSAGRFFRCTHVRRPEAHALQVPGRALGSHPWQQASSSIHACRSSATPLGAMHRA